MQCNIDARGKLARLVTGLASVGFAVTLAVLLIVGVLVSPWWWVAVLAAGVGGAFAIFEARAGWCAMRAMGLRTPI